MPSFYLRFMDSSFCVLQPFFSYWIHFHECSTRCAKWLNVWISHQIYDWTRLILVMQTFVCDTFYWLTALLAFSQVHLQTQQEVRMRMIGMTANVVRKEGYLALYSGLSASLCRQVETLTWSDIRTLYSSPLICMQLCFLPQMTYSLSRFAIYETVRDRTTRKNKGLMPFYQKVLLGAFGGKRCYRSWQYLITQRQYFNINVFFFQQVSQAASSGPQLTWWTFGKFCVTRSFIYKRAAISSWNKIITVMISHADGDLALKYLNLF